MLEKIIRKPVDGGSPEYWGQQRRGFKKVTDLHDAYAAPVKDGWWCELVGATNAAASHPGAVRILEAWGLKFERPYWNSYPVLLNKRGVHPKASEIPVFGKDRK